MNGIVNVYKPSGWTSFDVVRKLKKIYNTSHIGHLGTLDPLAEGVLPIAIGKATKLFDYYLNKRKTYIATFKAGEETDTLDLEGQVINKTENNFTQNQLEEKLKDFIGVIDQYPPKYSAIKINGKRAYELARKNIEFEIKSKKVEIFDIQLISAVENYYTFLICCSAGTYIRSLGRDIFKNLGSLATMTKLVRTQSGDFNDSGSVSIEEVEKNPEECVISLQNVLKHLPKHILEEKYKTQVLNGVRIKNNSKFLENQEFVLYIGEELVGIACIHDNKIIIKTNLYEGV